MARPMMRLLALIAALVGLAPTAGADEGASKSFAGWTGTCDNLGDCVAIGTSRADFFYLRISRAAGPAATPKVKIVLVTSDVLKGKVPVFALKAVTAKRAVPLGTFPAGPRDAEGAFVAEPAPGEPSRTFVDLVRNADTLDYALLTAKGTLDLDGLSATLRWIDAKQGRAGTSTAFVSRGPAPADQAPQPRRPPVVRAAKPGSVAAIADPPVNPDLVSRTAALPVCDKEIVEAHKAHSVWRLDADRLLVEVPCLLAAYNGASALYFTDRHGGSIRPVDLPKAWPDDADTPANVVTNMAFDAKTLELSEFGKGRGLGDCGETRTWLWTGESFALLRATRLSACPGALPGDWPNVFTAMRSDAPATKTPP